MSRVYLIEDHDEALRVWRRKKAKDLSLVHLDAHMDFDFHAARPLLETFHEAQSVEELKNGLEHSLAFLRFEQDFSKQTHIGNYIYPAMREEMVRDFYWVVPGDKKTLSKCAPLIKKILKDTGSRAGRKGAVSIKQTPEGVYSMFFLGRNFFVGTLDVLPVLKERVLLDIDTDYLVTKDIAEAEHTKKIGQRKPWISPVELVARLQEKIKDPLVVTVAYSVNGGFTPMGYKYLGDEIAYHLSPKDHKAGYGRAMRVARYFGLFCSTGKKKYYDKAVCSDPTYRAEDNNYGPLYMEQGRLSRAQKEFERIRRADPSNPACLSGLGDVALKKQSYGKAKEYFAMALVKSGHQKMFKATKKQSLLGLARAEYGLKNHLRAKEMFLLLKKRDPLDPIGYFFLGRIYEKEGEFLSAAVSYQDALRLGYGGLQPLEHLSKIACFIKKDDIINFIDNYVKNVKKAFLKEKHRRRVPLRKLSRIQERMRRCKI